MPTYPLKNLKTGETKTLSMTMQSYDEFRPDPANADWDRDWSQGGAGVGEVGECTDKLKQKYPGWNDVLKKAQKAPGSKIKTI